MKVRLAACSLLMFGLLTARPAMALFDTFYLFSEVKGTVLLNGKAIEGARVERHFHWTWKDRNESSEVLTNANGQFEFPAITDSSVMASLLPHEPVITQKIFIHYQGQEYKAWMFTKHGYHKNGELKGKPINLSCNLEAEPGYQQDVFGICTF